MEEVFENQERAEFAMKKTCSSNTIKIIVNRNFGITFHHHNFPDQHHHVHKHTGQKYQSGPFQTSKKF